MRRSSWQSNSTSHAQLLALGVQLVEGQHAEAVHARTACMSPRRRCRRGSSTRGWRRPAPARPPRRSCRTCRRTRCCARTRRPSASIIGSGVLPWVNAVMYVLEALLVGLFDDGPLAVVDAAVAAALDGGLLKHEHLLAALVGADERRPHARAAVADDRAGRTRSPRSGAASHRCWRGCRHRPRFHSRSRPAPPCPPWPLRPGPRPSETSDGTRRVVASFFMKDPSSSCRADAQGRPERLLAP